MRFLPFLLLVALTLSLVTPSGVTQLVPHPVPGVVEGFTIEPLVAAAVPTAIIFDSGPNPDLYVATLASGSVSRVDLTWTPSGPVAGGTSSVGSGFSGILGIAVDDDGYLYVADSHAGPQSGQSDGRVTRVDPATGAQEVIVDGLPQGQHNVNHLRFGPDGRLYMPVGNPNDHGTGTGTGHPDVFPYSGAILAVTPSDLVGDPAVLQWDDALGNDIPPNDIGTHPVNDDFAAKVEVAGLGFRNIFGVAFAPGDLSYGGELYTAMNGADDPASQDVLYKVEWGADHGFPYCYNVGPSGGVGSDVTAVDAPDVPAVLPPGPDCASVPPATANLGWHTCATGLDFPTQGAWAFPESFRSSVYVGECVTFGADSWVNNNRESAENGKPMEITHNLSHKVAQVVLGPDGHATEVKDFVTGLALATDVLFGPDGAMYIADAEGILRVAPVVPSSIGGNELPGAPQVPEAPQVSVETGDNEVHISAALFQFTPAAITVVAGTTVVWDGVLLPHTVTTTSSVGGRSHDTAGPDSFDEILGQGGEVRHTFNNPGIFNYFCRPHAGLGMVGTVIVAA